MWINASEVWDEKGVKPNKTKQTLRPHAGVPLARQYCRSWCSPSLKRKQTTKSLKHQLSQKLEFTCGRELWDVWHPSLPRYFIGTLTERFNESPSDFAVLVVDCCSNESKQMLRNHPPPPPDLSNSKNNLKVCYSNQEKDRTISFKSERWMKSRNPSPAAHCTHRQCPRAMTATRGCSIA